MMWVNANAAKQLGVRINNSYKVRTAARFDIWNDDRFESTVKGSIQHFGTVCVERFCIDMRMGVDHEAPCSSLIAAMTAST